MHSRFLSRREVLQRCGLGLVGAAIVQFDCNAARAQQAGFSLTGAMRRIRNEERMPLYSQPDGISCGPTAVAMVLKYYNREAGIGALKTACGTRIYSGPNFAGRQISVGLTLPAGIRQGLKSYGVGADVRGNSSLDDVMRLIDEDRPPILLVRSGRDTWHWLVVVGYYDDGARFLVRDPGSKERFVSARALEMGWSYAGTYRGVDIPNPECHTCAGSGEIRVPNVNIQCFACGGSGSVGFGRFKGTCPSCSGSGRSTADLPKQNCLVCGGRGHFPEEFRSLVGSIAPRKTLVVPHSAAADVGPIIWNGRERTRWSSADGRGKIISAGNGIWQEYVDGRRTFTFRETSATPTEIQLYDASRRITVRLTAEQNIVMAGDKIVLLVRGGWSN